MFPFMAVLSLVAMVGMMYHLALAKDLQRAKPVVASEVAHT